MEEMLETTAPHQSSVDVKLDYIQRDIRDIKDGMKDNVTRREFTDALVSIRQEIANLKTTDAIPTFWDRNQDKFIWGIIGIALTLFYWLLTQNGVPKIFN